jgi:hypothetical protein
METKATPLSREDRDAKRVRIDSEEFLNHVKDLFPKVEEVKKLKKAKK